MAFEHKPSGREGVNSVVDCDIQGGQFQAGRTARAKALRWEQARGAPRRAGRPQGRRRMNEEQVVGIKNREEDDPDHMWLQRPPCGPQVLFQMC